jgi:hypothetical protein
MKGMDIAQYPVQWNALALPVCNFLWSEVLDVSMSASSAPSEP